MSTKKNLEIGSDLNKIPVEREKHRDKEKERKG